MRAERHRAPGVARRTDSRAEAIGDWLHAADVARGILALLDTNAPDPVTFNIGYGEALSIRALIEATAAVVPGLQWQETEPQRADIVGRPEMRRGGWGAYHNSRLCSLGWAPMPIATAMADYVDWVRQFEGVTGR